MRERVVTITSGQNGLRYSVFARMALYLLPLSMKLNWQNSILTCMSKCVQLSLAKPPWRYHLGWM